MFCRIQNLHISQTWKLELIINNGFVEFKIYISLKQAPLVNCGMVRFVEFKIYISLKRVAYEYVYAREFCRIQNLHISQTLYSYLALSNSFVEFKIYISLKLIKFIKQERVSFVEFKIYISLKPQIEIWRKNFEFGYKKNGPTPIQARRQFR